MMELRDFQFASKKGHIGGAQPALYLDGAASCLIPIITAYPGTTGQHAERGGPQGRFLSI